MSGGDASGQNKASRTFFSTLNPQDRNINEFLNRESNEEGINFLQDSEIQSNQAQQQHQVHEQQHQVEHHHQQQQAPHQHQQHLDNQHPQGGQGFQTYQEFGQNEHYKVLDLIIILSSVDRKGKDPLLLINLGPSSLVNWLVF